MPVILYALWIILIVVVYSLILGRLARRSGFSG